MVVVSLRMDLVFEHFTSDAKFGIVCGHAYGIQQCGVCQQIDHYHNNCLACVVIAICGILIEPYEQSVYLASREQNEHKPLFFNDQSLIPSLVCNQHCSKSRNDSQIDEYVH